MELLGDLAPTLAKHFGARGQFSAFPKTWLPIALTRDVVAWGTTRNGAVAGSGNAGIRYGLPQPFTAWLYAWIETLESVFDDPSARTDFFLVG